MEKEKNIMKMVNYYLKENIQMEKGMEREKNIKDMIMDYYLKENIQMEKYGMEKEKYIMNMIN